MNELRDYFAVHAPLEVPHWYRPEQPELPRRLDYLSALSLVPGFCELSPSKQDTITLWMRDPCYDIEDELQKIGDAAFGLVVERNDAIEAARSGADAARFIGWRYQYADLMMREREADQRRREQAYRHRRAAA